MELDRADAASDDSTMEPVRLVLGAMTGTSIDGIDLALARIQGSGLAMRATLLAHRSAPLGTLAPRLRAAAQQQPMSAGDFAQLALDLGTLHAREAIALLAQDRMRGTQRSAAREAAPMGDSQVPPLSLAAIHGQTVYHRPPVSWQLVNPHPIARALGCAVVTDLRGDDLAAGGQGAPLTPLADWIALRAQHPRAIVNLGGFANATLLPADQGAPALEQVAAIRGRDLCACNQLLDRAARVALDAEYDAGGANAAAGVPDPHATAALLALLAPAADARSLGTGDELFDWIDAQQARLTPNALLASVAEAVGRTIGQRLRAEGASEVIVAGGGAHHQPLCAAIARAACAPVLPSDALGVPVTAREAFEWAILGALAADGIDPALAGVTRRPAVTTDPAPPRRFGLWTAAPR